MSIMRYGSGILTLRPSIKNHGERLVIKNGWLSRCVTLFLFLRKVEFLFNERFVIHSVTRFFFFHRTRIIGFEELSHIDYAFHSIGGSWWLTALGSGRHDQFESFAISLVTKKKEKHIVCAFRGDGAAVQGWIGAVAGVDVVDLSGTQESDSRQLASFLSRRTGLPIGEPFGVAKLMAECRSCGRPVSELSLKCIYCGAKN